MILAGDIGGTNTRLILLEPGAPLDRPIDLFVYKSNDHDGIVHLVREFLARSGQHPTAAAFGVAGPVIEGRARATNLKWIVDTAEIREALKTDHVLVKNDLETTGVGLTRLPATSFRVLNEGFAEPEGNAALIAAGTGLGKAILVREKTGFRPIPSEGGHSDFGPRDAEQDAIVGWMRRKYGHVSHERFVSGPGLKNLYDYCESRGDAEDSALSEKIASAGKDAPAQVAIAGLDRKSPRTIAALDLFVKVYAQSAQTLALTALATGGMFVGGGIAPKILPALVSGAFIEVFKTHPILGDLLARIPVKVALDDRASLLGAVTLASELLNPPK